MSIQVFFENTPQNKHASPENGGPLEKDRDSELGNHHFQVPAVNFWGCNDFFISLGVEITPPETPRRKAIDGSEQPQIGPLGVLKLRGFCEIFGNLL